MNIVQYIPYSYHIHSGGLEKIAQTLSYSLNKDDNINFINIASDIKRSSIEELSIYKDTLFIPSIDLIYNFPLPKFWIKRFWQHFSIIKSQNPDIIITHTRFFVQSFIGGLISKRLGCRRIHIEHGSGFVTGYPWYIKISARIFDWTIGLWIFRQCDTVVTISQMHKQFIRKFTKKDPVVIYNPIDYVPLAKAVNDVVHIGFVGRLVSLKGVDLLIKALASMQNKQWKCTIVGDGDQKDALEHLVANKKLSNRIRFVGADDRVNWLHQFDIFVNPSHQEGLPTTVVEALIAKCIVVATDVGGTREISDKEDLILVESGNVEELKRGIKIGLDSLDKSGNSYENTLEKFGIKKAIDKYRNVLDYRIATAGKK